MDTEKYFKSLVKSGLSNGREESPMAEKLRRWHEVEPEFHEVAVEIFFMKPPKDRSGSNTSKIASRGRVG